MVAEQPASVIQAARPNRIRARLLRAAVRVERTMDDADFVRNFVRNLVRMALPAIWRADYCDFIFRGRPVWGTRANVVNSGLKRQFWAATTAWLLRHITANKAAASCVEKRAERT